MTNHHAVSFCFLIADQLTIQSTLHNLGSCYRGMPILTTNVHTSQDRLGLAAIIKIAKNSSHLTQQEFISHFSMDTLPTAIIQRFRLTGAPL